MAASTKDRHRACPAEVCRENGWEVGTRLIGDEGYGPTVIEITALGEHKLLAKTLGRNGSAVKDDERSWVLYCREWREATADEVPVPLDAGTRVQFVHNGEPIIGTIKRGPDSQGVYVISANAEKLWLAKGEILEDE